MPGEKSGAKPKSGGAPIGIILGGGVGVLLMSIPIYLMAQGILAVEGPKFRLSDQLIMSDSLLSAYYATQDAFGLTDEGGAPAAGAKPPPAQGQIQTAGSNNDSAAGQIQTAAQPVQETEKQAAQMAAAQTTEAPKPKAAAAKPAAAKPAAGTVTQSTGTATNSDPNAVAVFNKSGRELVVDQAKLARLVKVYEKMRPKQVAVILGTMSVDQAAAILVLMKDKSAAEVLAATEAQRAARISQIMVRKQAG